jgi:hypothetical protein
MCGIVENWYSIAGLFAEQEPMVNQTPHRGFVAFCGMSKDAGMEKLTGQRHLG